MVRGALRLSLLGLLVLLGCKNDPERTGGTSTGGEAGAATATGGEAGAATATGGAAGAATATGGAAGAATATGGAAGAATATGGEAGAATATGGAAGAATATGGEAGAATATGGAAGAATATGGAAGAATGGGGTGGSNSGGASTGGADAGGAGAIGAAGVAGAGGGGPVLVDDLVVAPAYSGGLEWMTYIQNDGASVYSASGTPCDPASMNGYASCVHVAELHEMAIPALTNCADVVGIWDSVGAFEWTCDDSSSVVVRSAGLRPAAGLRDLIAFGDATTDPAWKTLRVTVEVANGSLYRSAESAWWTNPIVALPLTGSVTSVYFEGRIFVVKESGTGGASITSDRTAYVTAPGVTIASPGTGYNVAMAGDFQWAEVDIAGPAGVSGIRSGSDFAAIESHGNVIRHSSLGLGTLYLDQYSSDGLVYGTQANGISIDGDRHTAEELVSNATLHLGSNGSLDVVRNVTIDLDDPGDLTCLNVVGDDGLVDGAVCPNAHTGALVEGTHNTLRGLVATGVRDDASLNDDSIGVWLTEARHRVIDTVLADFDYCVLDSEDLTGPSKQGAMTLQHLRMSDCGSNDLVEGEAAMWLRLPNHRLIDVVVVGSSGHSLLLGGGHEVVLDATVALNASGPSVVAGAFMGQVVSVGNGITGLTITEPATPAPTLANVALAHNGDHGLRLQSTDPINPNVVDGLLVGSNGAGDCFDLPGGGCPPVTNGLDLSSVFVGEVSDSANLADDASGVAPFAALDVLDWATFEHDYRVWGPASTVAFPSGSAAGNCVGGACQIYDFALAATPSPLLDALPVPDASGVVSHVWDAATEEECNWVDPGAWNGVACVTRFHRLGIETYDVPGEAGDGDGLCEAGEPCLRVRNLGAYQGHGALVPVEGDFDFGADGVFSFYEYAENGR